LSLNDVAIRAKVLWQGIEAADSMCSTARRDNDARLGGLRPKLLLYYLVIKARHWMGLGQEIVCDLTMDYFFIYFADVARETHFCGSLVA
jgi:hypothetical protein